MSEDEPKPGQLWTLTWGDVTANALVVQTGEGYLVVWPVSTVSETQVILWPSLATGVYPARATQLITQLMPEDDCDRLRIDHRDTAALRVTWSAGQLVFSGVSPMRVERRGLMEQMEILGEHQHRDFDELLKASSSGAPHVQEARASLSDDLREELKRRQAEYRAQENAKRPPRVGESFTMAELEAHAAAMLTPPHQCSSCRGVDPGSCENNPEAVPPENEAATVLARYLAGQDIDTLQAAFELLGWDPGAAG